MDNVGTVHTSSVTIRPDVIESITFLKDKFVKEKCQVDFYPYQKDPSDYIVKSILEQRGEEILLEFSRQSGKTEMVANLCYFLALYLPYMKNWKQGFRIGIFAPKLDQAAITFNRLKTRMSEEVLTYLGLSVEVSNGNTLSFSNGSVIKCLSARDSTDITGETFDLIILEECQKIGERKLKAEIFPMGASTNATRILIGTAWFQRSYFYSAVRKYKGKENSFIYDYHITQEYNENYKKYVAAEKDRIGEESDEFRAMYGLEWILARGQLVEYETIMLGARSDFSIINATEDYVYVGLDNGKAADSTVLTIAQPFGDGNLKIIRIVELIGDDYESQFKIISDVLAGYPNIQKFCIDATGNQDMVVDRYRAMKRFKGTNIVEGITFSLSSKDQMYKYVGQLFRENKITFPYDIKKPTKVTREIKRFIDQFTEIEKEYKGNYMVCNAPEGKEYHDDYCDSFALCALASKTGLAIPKLTAASYTMPTHINDNEKRFQELIGIRPKTGIAFV